MTGITEILIKMYRLLLKLYPSSFRSEFEEQMLLDFEDMVADARRNGRFSFALFCLHELVDFLGNLIIVYFRDSILQKILVSQPINHAWRGALGYGFAFGMSILISEFVNIQLYDFQTG